MVCESLLTKLIEDFGPFGLRLSGISDQPAWVLSITLLLLQSQLSERSNVLANLVNLMGHNHSTTGKQTTTTTAPGGW